MTTMNENNNNNATILLVDNEPDNTCILSICLEDEGFKVDAFNDPQILNLISTICQYLILICLR